MSTLPSQSIRLKAVALTLNAPNQNGRLYPKAVMEKALAKALIAAHYRLPVYKSVGSSDVTNIAGEAVNAAVEGDTVVVELALRDQGVADLISQGKLSVRTRGRGTVCDHKVMSDYVLDNFFLTSDPA